MKRFSLITLLFMLMFIMYSCSGSNKNPAADIPPLEALKNIWNSYDESDKFAVGGGDSSNPIMDGPGEFAIDNAENVEVQLGLPEDQINSIDSAASLVHMMNLNTFTAAAFHITDNADINKVSQSIADNLKNRNWMCGFPDKLVIVTLDNNTLISVFGAEDLVDAFVKNTRSTYKEAAVAIEQSLVF